MLLLRNLCKVDLRSNIISKVSPPVCRLSRNYSDEVKEPTATETKETNDKVIKEEEQTSPNFIQIHQEYKSEVVVDNHLDFESRLEHYKKLGIKAEVKSDQCS